jgi:hypothetical protein
MAFPGPTAMSGSCRSWGAKQTRYAQCEFLSVDAKRSSVGGFATFVVIAIARPPALAQPTLSYKTSSAPMATNTTARGLVPAQLP